MRRAMCRTAICFACLFVFYLGLSFLVSWQTTLETLCSRSFWLEFLLFNRWTLPVESTIWFVQAMLYAYAIIYVLNKCDLLRFDIVIASVCLLVTVLTGELAAVIGLNFMGRTYIGGNFLTRALPYILLGSFLNRKRAFFLNLPFLWHLGIAGGGLILGAMEFLLLRFTGNMVYTDHLLGMGVFAFGLCLITLCLENMEVRTNALPGLSRWEICIPYFISSPVYIACLLYFNRFSWFGTHFGNYISFITLLICLVLWYIYSVLRMVVWMWLHRFEHEET